MKYTNNDTVHRPLTEYETELQKALHFWLKIGIIMDKNMNMLHNHQYFHRKFKEIVSILRQSEYSQKLFNDQLFSH